jgi:hypothetical protein
MAPNNIRIETAKAINETAISKRVDFVFLHQTGASHTQGRNEMCQVFGNEQFHKSDRILMVDGDIGFEPEDVTALLEDDLPIVSGVYRGIMQERVMPVVFEWAEVNGKRRLLPIDKEPENQVFKASGVGAGFLMLHRDVVNDVYERYGHPYPWFAEDVHDGQGFSEDLSFCLRAQECGYDIHVDSRVQVAHYKSVKLGGRKDEG